MKLANWSDEDRRVAALSLAVDNLDTRMALAVEKMNGATKALQPARTKLEPSIVHAGWLTRQAIAISRKLDRELYHFKGVMASLRVRTPLSYRERLALTIWLRLRWLLKWLRW